MGEREFRVTRRRRGEDAVAGVDSEERRRWNDGQFLRATGVVLRQGPDRRLLGRRGCRNVKH